MNPTTNTARFLGLGLVLLLACSCKSDDPMSPKAPAELACSFDLEVAEAWTDGVGRFDANATFGTLSVEGTAGGADPNCTGSAHFKDQYRIFVPDNVTLSANRRAIVTLELRYHFDGSGADQNSPDGRVRVDPRYGANGLPWVTSSSSTSGAQDETVEIEILAYVNRRDDDRYLDSRIEVKASVQLNTVNDQSVTMRSSAEILGITGLRLEDGTEIPSFEICSESGARYRGSPTP